MTLEIYKRFRPKRLSHVAGNKSTVATLQSMLKNGDLPHTILFHGPSGCGKTTLGRIVRRELGCGMADFRELNCSDFRGVDTIRDISRSMTLSPIGGKCRIFLLDEVHQLTKDGQHAALKILEDTPRHVYFILCTTDPGKLLKTIRTRCCELPVEPLSEKELKGLVSRICTSAEIKITEEHLDALVERSQGSARTALVILDKISHLPRAQREAAIGMHSDEKPEVIALCRAIFKKDWRSARTILKDLTEEPESVRWAVLGYARSVVLNRGKDDFAFGVLCAFEGDFFDSKAAGLARACYEAIFGES